MTAEVFITGRYTSNYFSSAFSKPRPVPSSLQPHTSIKLDCEAVNFDQNFYFFHFIFGQVTRYISREAVFRKIMKALETVEDFMFEDIYTYAELVHTKAIRCWG